jgi:hypothetical protein
MKKIVTLSSMAFLSTLCFADAPVQEQIDALKKEIASLKKAQSRSAASISEVKKATGGDNIKFGLDFRNAIDALEYKDNDNDLTSKNPSLLTSRLYLDMAAAPIDGLMFKGRLAIYSTWGAHIFDESAGLKDWSASSRATDTVMRIKEAYFVYSNSLGEQPVSFSIGRRPSTNGALANYRENEKTSGSPLAHITNMEVNAAMVKLSWDRFVSGAYTKLVYGRAHTGEAEGAYGENPAARFPYADEDTSLEDENVDFFVMPGDAYNDGQYQIMYQWAHIFDTKGKALNGAGTVDDVNKAASGSADLFSLGLKVDGIGDEISDFLDATTVFVSGAYTNYSANDGYSLLGSEDGGSESGSSVWVGAIIPDGFTDSGKFGFEYNHGSKYWSPMTWAEDTAIGSKIAVRGSAYEAYWNFDLFGVKYLPAQVRYTYVQHDYTPNINCAGWVAPAAVDITAQDLRLAVSYRY